MAAKKDSKGRKGAAKARFLRFCFAKGICSKGSGGKVKGITNENKELMTKALRGNKSANKKLSFQPKSRGGFAFGSFEDKKPSIKMIESDIAKRTKSRAIQSGGIDRSEIAERVNKARKINPKDLRKAEQSALKNIASELRAERDAKLKRARTDKGRERIRNEYNNKFQERIGDVRFKIESALQRNTVERKLFTDPSFIRSIAKPKRR